MNGASRHVSPDIICPWMTMTLIEQGKFPSSVLFLSVIFIDVWAENSYSHKWNRKEVSNENVTQAFCVKYQRSHNDPLAKAIISGSLSLSSKWWQRTRKHGMYKRICYAVTEVTRLLSFWEKCPKGFTKTHQNMICYLC